MGFVYKKKRGNLALKGGEEGEGRGSLVGVLWVRFWHSENREKLREFARKKERKTWVRGEVSF